MNQQTFVSVMNPENGLSTQVLKMITLMKILSKQSMMVCVIFLMNQLLFHEKDALQSNYKSTPI